MGKALGIATVTASLRALLDYALNSNAPLVDALGDITVTALSPDQAATAINGTGINIYLFRITHNTSLRNPGAVFQGAGTTIVRPPFGVDLQILISAYARQSYAAEMMLGHVMDTLHESPVLSRDLMRRVLAHPVSRSTPEVLRAFSADQTGGAEQLKVSPLSLSIDELSNFWRSVQSPFVPSIAYAISTVVV